MTGYEYEIWDVFTDRAFAGNPLAVVMSAEGLSTDDMQSIAREFNLSETSFVLPSEDSANTARVRIFTPAYEMPFAGHPTVGTAIAIAKARKLTGALHLELKAGLFPVKIDMDRAAPFAQFENPNPPREQGGAPVAALIERALNLPEGAVDRGAHRPRRIGAGVNFIYAKAALENVRSASLDNAGWNALGLEETVGVLLYAEGGEAGDASYHVRMFAPSAGVAEDPATGSAACALPGQVALSQKLDPGPHSWLVEQGFEMGRPSRIHVDFEAADGTPGRVSIGGSAAAVAKGQLFI